MSSTGKGEIHRKNLLDVDADGFGLGANVGATYQVNENNRFGITYRYSPDIEVEGDITKGGVSADKMNVPLPDTLEFSGWHQLNEQWAFHYSLQWVNWSEFDSLTSDSYDDSIKEYQWKDGRTCFCRWYVYHVQRHRSTSGLHVRHFPN